MGANSGGIFGLKTLGFSILSFISSMLRDCPTILDQTHAKDFYTVCLLSITAEIDMKKLPFLGRLCELKTLYLTMRICIVLLFSYLFNVSTKHYGVDFGHHFHTVEI